MVFSLNGTRHGIRPGVPLKSIVIAKSVRCNLQGTLVFLMSSLVKDVRTVISGMRKNYYIPKLASLN